MKILSWNIWVDGHFDELKSFLANADADIIGLQEVQDDDSERDVIGYLTGLGYAHVFAKFEIEWDGKTYRFGPAVFSRLPVVHSDTYEIDDDGRSVARADIQTDDGILHVFSTHLVHTHQVESEEQLAQVKRLIEKLPNERVIVMGDFNAVPESSTIRKMKEVLVDTDPSSSPTWSVYPECGVCQIEKPEVRLDYIFVSKDLNAHSFEVGQSRASDHLPVSVIVQ